jgi:hypothetical protein
LSTQEKIVALKKSRAARKREDTVSVAIDAAVDA